MEAFDDIRPYRDDEVPAVLRRLIEDPDAIQGAAIFLAPRWYRWAPKLTSVVIQKLLERRTRRVESVDDIQFEFTSYFARLIRQSTSGFTWSGLEALDPDQAYLFVSNHRDIALDSGFMNYALWLSGHSTSQIAVGDNLFTHVLATDLMRLNKSFVVERGATGAKAQYAALLKTSRYIRAAMESGESTWIAQREGRSKDGLDKTEPALFKMFLLAYRPEVESFGDWLRLVRLVPVSISYELDPCAGLKAKELYITARDGSYEKPAGEDLASIVQGIVGFKGEVHVGFGAPVHGEFEHAETLAAHVDRVIIGNLKTFATQVLALDGDAQLAPRIKKAFDEALDACPPEHREFLLMQYANQLKNKRSLTGDRDSS